MKGASPFQRSSTRVHSTLYRGRSALKERRIETSSLNHEPEMFENKKNRGVVELEIHSSSPGHTNQLSITVVWNEPNMLVEDVEICGKIVMTRFYGCEENQIRHDHRNPQIKSTARIIPIPRCSASGPNRVRGAPSYMPSLTFIMEISPAWQPGVGYSDIFYSVRVATRHPMKATMRRLYSLRTIAEEPTNAALVYDRIKNFKVDEDNNGEDHVELILGTLKKVAGCDTLDTPYTKGALERYAWSGNHATTESQWSFFPRASNLQGLDLTTIRDVLSG
ncbi:hypothetical protein VNO77_22892 [Canavalia gladiata]|uniref:Uncharacterized protein n=1 Tax=Canavalia gladiata TaxID=3824 RepID=A0AAN9QB76_CANGL